MVRSVALEQIGARKCLTTDLAEEALAECAVRIAASATAGNNGAGCSSITQKKCHDGHAAGA
jgi:hypothetical protein